MTSWSCKPWALKKWKLFQMNLSSRKVMHKMTMVVFGAWAGERAWSRAQLLCWRQVATLSRRNSSWSEFPTCLITRPSISFHMVQHPLSLTGVSSPGWIEVSERVPGLKELYHFNSQSNNALFYCHCRWETHQSIQWHLKSMKFKSLFSLVNNLKSVSGLVMKHHSGVLGLQKLSLSHIIALVWSKYSGSVVVI
jgi:hypothetical protein